MKIAIFVLLLNACIFVHSMPDFGKDMKRRFLIDPSVIFLNHGSRGAVPRTVFHRQMQLKRKMEANPSDWFRAPSKRMYDDAVSAAAKFVNAKKENLVIVDNASTGVGTAIDNLQFNAGDGIIIMDHTYSGIRKKAQKMVDKFGTVTIKLETPMEIPSEDTIIDLYRNALEENPNIKAAIIDHVTSPLGLVLPIEKLAVLCHQYGVVVIIDGAHAPGQVDVNMNGTNVDFYVGNFYKWAYASHACAFLWISPKYMDQVTPLVTSKFYPAQSLQHQFHFFGTRDTTNFYSLPTALEFYEKLGGRDVITTYNRNLLNTFSSNLTQAVGAVPFPMIESMRAPGMLTMLLPFKYDGDSDDITNLFSTQYKIEVVFFTVGENTALRVLANVYNTPEELVKLQSTVVNFVEEFKAGRAAELFSV